MKTLLEIPELRLRLRAGTGLLEREVSRIYVTELRDPGRYVAEGELVLSGLLWWHEPGDAEPFVAALARARCAALAASGADTGGIPEDVVEACERHRIPLVEVPVDLSFAVVTERVVLALATESGGARKRLLSAATEHATLPSLLTHGAAELGADCWVRSETGRLIAGSAPGAPRERTVLAVGGRHAIGWSLVVDSTLDSPGVREIADELAGLVGLARARQDEVATAGMRIAEPLLRVLDTPGASGAELATAFAAAGLGTDVPMRVLVARTPGRAIAGEVLGELLAEHGSTVLLGDSASDTGAAYALAGADVAWPADWAAAAERTLAAIGGGRILVGIGGPATVSGLRGASEEARHAAEAAARRPHRVGVVSGEEIGPHRLLLAGAPDELRRALRERLLGPLLDTGHGGPDLLHTVRVFLECSGSPAKAAKALHVHVNTLRYRVARASELLGLDLTDFRTQVDVYLALCVEVPE